MTKQHLIKTAKLEIQEWRGLPNGLVLAILFAFIHRATEDESIEQTFRFPATEVSDYEI